MKRIIAPMLALVLASSPAGAADDVAQLKALLAKEWTLPELGLKLTRIPAGSFVMGSPNEEPERREDEVQHEVTISNPFYMGVYEVTQKEYYDIMVPDFDHDSWQYARGPIHAGLAMFYRERKSKEDYTGGKLNLRNPMECVPWHRAREFCRKITARERKAGRLPEGYVYRLPTEAEWEYACRAGTTGSYNVTGASDSADSLKSADYLGSFANVGGGCPTTVGGRKPNKWGLYDMHGNVYEWCLDWYGPYPNGKVADPTGPATGGKRVARGGCFNGTVPFSPPGVIASNDGFSGVGPFLRSASRYQFSSDADFYAILGFRVVLGRAMATDHEAPPDR
ncbi:MAG: formylglycine-generating enzyme family protein [Verrucomicrobia bacterium]|nr:formylglycine-generating enzyme family protein [Verrucomicrobiota bacterium]